MNLAAVYRHRFSECEKLALAGVWKVLVEDCFQHWIGPDDAVLDVGAGLCLFINQVKAKRKVAVDANREVYIHCAADVIFVNTRDLDSADLGDPFDVIFISNFLEHLENSGQVLRVLLSAHKRLKPGGRLVILQPNFRLLGARYFDFIDHKTILTDVSLLEALDVTNYDILFFKKRFLPYTSKSRLPKFPWLVRLYLKFPIAQYFLGKQTLVVAKARSDRSNTHDMF
jgi:SAM-dependent methyltransferase